MILPPLIGAVADDFTGATDLASMLARGGLRTVLRLGLAGDDAPPPASDALLVALKSRTAPVADAVADSLAAWRWMATAGAPRCYFKICSTFDSTPVGNIGPVAEALMAALGADRTVYSPAFPENGRTIYQGKLFVGDRLLSETGMAQHPLTPMTEPDLRRALRPQLQDGARTGLAPWSVVRRGAAALRAHLEGLCAAAGDGAGTPAVHVVVDALEQADLDVLAEVVRDWPLVVAGSGLGLSLAAALASAEGRGGDGHVGADALPSVGGPTLLLSGSCSQATNAQVARWEASGRAVLRPDPLALAEGRETHAELIAAALAPGGPRLVAATRSPDEVRAAQSALGAGRAATIVEAALAAVARAALQAGFRRFVVAGGETSGAVAAALGAERLLVGPSIAPGVPWCATSAPAPIALALKSGNFGDETFFEDALACAP